MLRPAMLAFVLLAAAPALAQTPPGPSAHQGEPLNDQTRPMPGANSYSRAQAAARIERLGFGQVDHLHKDRQGIWRGTAMQGGHARPVWMDYRGRVGNF